MKDDEYYEEYVVEKKEKSLIEELEKFFETNFETIKMYEDMLKEANETNKMLLEIVPKVLGPEGVSVCKFSERVFPGDKVIIIRYDPRTQRIDLSIMGGEQGRPGIKVGVFNSMLRSAIELAESMLDDDGMLSKDGNRTGKIKN